MLALKQILCPVPPLVFPGVDRTLVATEVQRLVEAERVPGVPVEALVIEAPEVYREILGQAERLRSDLVVIGTHDEVLRAAADMLRARLESGVVRFKSQAA